MYFENDKINFKKIKNKKQFLLKLSLGLYNLSHSNVCEGNLAIGGFYHKNYYNHCCSSFFDKKNKVFFMKNALKSEFIFNLKHNLCNFGIYFSKIKKDIFIEIYSGNSFKIDENLEHFLEKFISNCDTLKLNKVENVQFKNFYLTYLKKLKINNVLVKSKNKRVNFYTKKLQLKNNSHLKIVVSKNLKYKMFVENTEIKLNNIIKIFKIKEIQDNEKIEKINLNKLKNVVNDDNILYNRDVNYFDIFYTIQKIIQNLTCLN